MRSPVIVVGAGPTGVLLAIELARRGIEVRIVDKQASRSRESRAIAIHARSLELLHQASVVDEFLELGRRVDGFSWHSRGRRALQMSFDGIGSRYPFMLMLPQHETQRILDERLESLGVAIERGVRVSDVHQDEHGVELAVRDLKSAGERRLVADWVVGCDGAHSVVRDRVGVPFDGDAYGQDWLMAEVQVDWPLSEAEFHVFMHPRGTLATFPLPSGRWRFFLPQVPDRGDGRPAPDLEEIADLVRQRGPRDIQIGDPGLLACFRCERRSALRHRVGRVVLAGDAAHIHSPAGGQGMNTGLQDAFNLGWKLGLVVAGNASPALLDSYEAERAPVAASVLRLTHGLVEVVNARTAPRRAARDALLPVVSARGAVRRRATRRLAQVSFTYRDGPLALQADGDRHGRLAPGDRVPDIDGLVRGAAAVSLLDLLAHPRHTLLVLTGTTAARAVVPDHLAAYSELIDIVVIDPRDARSSSSAVIDTCNRAHRRFGADRGRAVLVRPDGHIACSSRLDQPEPVLRYLSAVAGPDTHAEVGAAGEGQDRGSSTGRVHDGRVAVS